MSRRILLLTLLVLANLARADMLVGRVVGVHDGDTVTVLTATGVQIKVRVAWIDAPELGQPFGQAAKRALSELVFGHSFELDSIGLDRYGRRIAVVMVEGKDAGYELVRQGLAWVYDFYLHRDCQDPELIERYDTAQTGAMEQSLRLRQDAAPVPPWNWRKVSRNTWQAN